MKRLLLTACFTFALAVVPSASAQSASCNPAYQSCLPDPCPPGVLTAAQQTAAAVAGLLAAWQAVLTWGTFADIAAFLAQWGGALAALGAL
jgi:hypothetical protein